MMPLHGDNPDYFSHYRWHSVQTPTICLPDCPLRLYPYKRTLEIPYLSLLNFRSYVIVSSERYVIISRYIQPLKTLKRKFPANLEPVRRPMGEET